jgi:hypothetical protein
MPFHTQTVHKEQDKPKNTRPTPQSRNEPADSSHTAARKETSHGAKIITHSPHHPCYRRAVKMLASTMQISNNNPTNPLTPPHRRRSDEERNTKANPDTPPPTDHSAGHGRPTADPSGPNSVFNHVPTNVRPMTRKTNKQNLQASKQART